MPPAQLGPDARALYDRINAGPRGASMVDDRGALIGPFNAMLLSPALGDPLQELGAAIRYRSSLTDRCRELAILIVALFGPSLAVGVTEPNPNLDWSALHVRVPVGASSNVAVNSVATATNTRQTAAAAAGAVSRSVTRMNVADGELPNDREASSRLGGTCAKPARTLTSARGMNNRT